MSRVLTTLLEAEPTPTPHASVTAWWDWHRERTRGIPVDRAFLGGFAADRLAWAFAAGYEAAGAVLAVRAGIVEETPQLGALCATEAGGAHPRAIHTRLTPESGDRWRLQGHKSFVTFGAEAQRLLVVATTGPDDQGRNRLRLARVDPSQAGVEVTPLPAIPFVPEIPHAEVRLEGVVLTGDALLPGDGYDLYLKPFRTIEDCHVHAALLGWLLQVARRCNWDREAIAAWAARVVAMRSLALADPSSPAVHVALAGAMNVGALLMERFESMWERVDAPTRERWERDRSLLKIASGVRARRLESAWRDLGG